MQRTNKVLNGVDVEVLQFYANNGNMGATRDKLAGSLSREMLKDQQQPNLTIQSYKIQETPEK